MAKANKLPPLSLKPRALMSSSKIIPGLKKEHVLSCHAGGRPWCALSSLLLTNALQCGRQAGLAFCVEITVVILNSAEMELFACQVWYFIKQWFVYLD